MQQLHAAAHFHCDRCGAGFTAKKGLEGHRKSKTACDENLRKQRSGIQCHYCSAKFICEGSLVNHEAWRQRNRGRCPTRKISARGGRK